MCIIMKPNRSEFIKKIVAPHRPERKGNISPSVPNTKNTEYLLFLILLSVPAVIAFYSLYCLSSLSQSPIDVVQGLRHSLSCLLGFSKYKSNSKRKQLGSHNKSCLQFSNRSLLQNFDKPLYQVCIPFN